MLTRLAHVLKGKGRLLATLLVFMNPALPSPTLDFQSSHKAIVGHNTHEFRINDSAVERVFLSQEILQKVASPDEAIKLFGQKDGLLFPLEVQRVRGGIEFNPLGHSSFVIGNASDRVFNTQIGFFCQVKRAIQKVESTSQAVALSNFTPEALCPKILCSEEPISQQNLRETFSDLRFLSSVLSERTVMETFPSGYSPNKQLCDACSTTGFPDLTLACDLANHDGTMLDITIPQLDDFDDPYCQLTPENSHEPPVGVSGKYLFASSFPEIDPSPMTDSYPGFIKLAKDVNRLASIEYEPNTRNPIANPCSGSSSRCDQHLHVIFKKGHYKLVRSIDWGNFETPRPGQQCSANVVIPEQRPPNYCSTSAFSQSDPVADIMYCGIQNVTFHGCGSTIEVSPSKRRVASRVIGAANIENGQFQGKFLYESRRRSLIPFRFADSRAFTVKDFNLYGNADKTTIDLHEDICPRGKQGGLKDTYKDNVDCYLKALDGPGSLNVCAVKNEITEPASYGIHTSASSNYSIENVVLHHFAGDGILMGAGVRLNDRKGSVADRDARLKNVVSNYNGRQGLSIIYANNVEITGSRFSENGNTEGVYPGHSPRAGINVEPDAKGYRPANTAIRQTGHQRTVDIATGNITVRDSELSLNVGTQFSSSGVAMEYNIYLDRVDVVGGHKYGERNHNEAISVGAEGVVITNSRIQLKDQKVIVRPGYGCDPAGAPVRTSLVLRDSEISGWGQLINSGSKPQKWRTKEGHEPCVNTGVSKPSVTIENNRFLFKAVEDFSQYHNDLPHRVPFIEKDYNVVLQNQFFYEPERLKQYSSLPARDVYIGNIAGVRCRKNNVFNILGAKTMDANKRYLISSEASTGWSVLKNEQFMMNNTLTTQGAGRDDLVFTCLGDRCQVSSISQDSRCEMKPND